jgi:plasmid stabilization system protein ParE
MKVILSERVESDIAGQLQYGLDHFGRAVVERMFARVDTFLFRFLPVHPHTGKYLDDLGIYEAWIAGTPFVVFYRVGADAETITVLAFYHHAQDRAAFEPQD